MKIAIDFDGTCVKHAFPEVGADIGAVPVLKALVAKGHQLILFTMRCDHNGVEVDSPEFPGKFSGNYLSAAIDWFAGHNITLHGVQADPEQKEWTVSPKCYAHLYIDDCGLGIPLIHEFWEDRPYVDWEAVEAILIKRGIL